MKREEHYSDLWRFFPLFFWYKCSKCGKEFRRERGWRAITSPYINTRGTSQYLCYACAPTKDIANKYFLNKEWIPPRPKYAPPRPPRSRNLKGKG